MEAILAGIILIVYAICCCIKLKEMPISISQTVKALNHDWVWVITMWAIGILAGTKMLELTPDGWQAIPFGYMVSQFIVGAAPWTKTHSNTVHNVAGILTCIFSQAWVGIVNPTLLLAWIPYLLVFLFDKRRWCWWSEWVSMGTTIAATLLN